LKACGVFCKAFSAAFQAAFSAKLKMVARNRIPQFSVIAWRRSRLHAYRYIFEMNGARNATLRI
jgi:hypothetical protein